MNNVLRSRVIIYRNVKDFKFEPKLSVENKQKIIEILSDALKGKMSLFSVNKNEGNVFKHLKSNNLIVDSANNIFIEKEGKVAINMFSGEHISIVSACVGFDKSVILNAVELSQMLSNRVSFAYNDEYGYLMSDLNKIGSGIRVESEIMLSAIKKINKIEQVRQNLGKLGYVLKETNYPAVYRMSTKCNLGLGEKKIFEDFENTLAKLQDLEIESVKMLDVTNHDEMLDKVSRSMAILSSAHMLTYDELYNIVVNLRMGKNLGLINLKTEKLNQLQNLVTSKTNEIVAQGELIELAKKAKDILKGE